MNTASLFPARRATLLVVLAALSMPQCFLDQSGRAQPTLEANAQPTLICPGDPVTVTWQYGYASGDPLCTLDDSEEDCPVAAVVELAPAEAFTDPEPRTPNGSQTLHPDEDLTVTVDAYRLIRVADDPEARTGEVTQRFAIDVIEDEIELAANALGACLTTPDGRVPGWRPLTLRRSGDLGASVAYVALVNTSPYELRVTVRFEDGSTGEGTVARGDRIAFDTLRTTRDGGPVVEVQAVPTDPAVLTGARCPPERPTGPPPDDRPPPSFQVVLVAGCG